MVTLASKKHTDEIFHHLPLGYRERSFADKDIRLIYQATCQEVWIYPIRV